MRLWHTSDRRQEKGVFLLLTALMLVVLFGVVGLAIDVSRQLVVSAELQNSADACALGGVLDLNGAPDAPRRAAQSGRFVGGMNVEDFQHDPVGYSETDITFSEFRDGPYLTASAAPANSGFIKCVARHNGLANVFMGVLGFKFSDLSSVAIATMNPSQVTCMAPFMIVVNRVYAVYPRGEDFGLTGKTVAYDASESVMPYLNLAAYGTISTSLVTDFIASPNKCNIPTKPGTCLSKHAPASSSVEPAWNTRFGIYKNVYSPSMSPPDRTGVGYTSYLDFSSYQNDAALHKPANVTWANKFGYSMKPSDYVEYGVTNRRVVAIPVVPKSSEKCASGERAILGWVCGWMLRPYDSGVPEMVILGSALAQGSPCGTMGIPGSDAYGPLVPALVE